MPTDPGGSSDEFEDCGPSADLEAQKEATLNDIDERLAAARTERLGFQGMSVINKVIIGELLKSNEQLKITHQYDSFSIFPEKYKFLETKNAINDNKIPVQITINEKRKVFVRVGPCDLSGAGKHAAREEIIKYAVNDALANAGLTGKTFENVNVSVQVGVRGRLQVLTGYFTTLFDKIARLCRSEKNYKTYVQMAVGTHQNAYVKTEAEPILTHWEPRVKGEPLPIQNEPSISGSF